MAWTAWRRPGFVGAFGDGSQSPWNQFDGAFPPDTGATGDNLSDTPSGSSEVYWFCNSQATQFSPTARASQFGFAAEGIGNNDSIDGIEVETITQSSNGSRPNGLRVLAISKTGLIEDSQNKATRVLSGSEVTAVYGGEFDPWGVEGLAKLIVESNDFSVFWRTEAGTTSGNRARMKSLRMRLNVITDGLLTPVRATAIDLAGQPIAGAVVHLEAMAGGALAAGTVVLSGVTDASGQVSAFDTFASDQPVRGAVRKGSSAPFYRQGVLGGVISATSGYNQTAVLSEE